MQDMKCNTMHVFVKISVLTTDTVAFMDTPTKCVPLPYLVSITTQCGIARVEPWFDDFRTTERHSRSYI